MGAFSNFYLNSQSSEHYYWSPWRSEKAKKWILMVLRFFTWAFQYCISDCLLHDCVSKKEMMDGRGYYGFIILMVGRNNLVFISVQSRWLQPSIAASRHCILKHLLLCSVYFIIAFVGSIASAGRQNDASTLVDSGVRMQLIPHVRCLVVTNITVNRSKIPK